MADSPYLYENTIRHLDEAVYNWLGGFLVDYGELAGVTRNKFPILRVFASPHRAYAETVNQLVTQGWIAGGTPEEQRLLATYDWPTLPLPVVSIERDDPIISNELSASATHVQRARFNYETQEYEQDPYPFHYLTQYRLTFWCEKRYTHAAFTEWLLSQLGRAGATQSEMYLTLEHPKPYGKQLHQWRYLGSANLSDLEGPESRHIRSLLSFTLRSWAFRKPDFSAPPVYTTQVDSSVSTDPSAESADSTFPADVCWGTNNLFIPGRSPRTGSTTGAATVSSDADAALIARLVAPGDTVVLTSPMATPGIAGRSIWSLSVDADATSPWVLEATQLDADAAETTVARMPLPASRGISHTFAVADSREFRASVAADVTPTTVRVYSADIRQLTEMPRIVPASYGPTATTITYQWDYLERRPYLVVGILESGAGAVDVLDDAALPEHLRSALVDATVMPGFAVLTMPKTSTLCLAIAPAVKLASVWVQVFDGPFYGARV